MKLEQVRAVITGGASGLGNATAARLVAGGAQVTLLDVNHEAGEAAAKALGSAARFQAADVTSESAVNDAIAAARSAMGEINLAVNCAGVAWARRLVIPAGRMPGYFFS
jgi:NAD(P)-dependent dehydrogenase (short-subunit alcohol dehydrogenase family)